MARKKEKEPKTKKVKEPKVKKVKEPKTKKKREKHLLGKGEFIFNFISLVCMIGMGIYFGYRSLYYYSMQNRQYEENSKLLNGFIIQNNQIVQEEQEGLHHDTDGYFFRGNVTNNYVWFANRMFRVVRINEDGSVRLVTDTNAAIYPWGNPVAFRDSNLYYWLNKTDWESSGYYYHTLPNVEDFLVKTNYREDVLEESGIREVEETSSEYVSLITIKDYVLSMSGGKNSYLSNGKMFFLLGINSDNKNLYVEEDGSILPCETTEGFGIRPVITMKPDTPISGGEGTKENPYIITQNEKTNYVASYVKLGDDIWRVFGQNADSLSLHLNGYIQANGEEILKNYSQTNSIYDIMDEANVGWYLNNEYLGNLPYKDILQPFNSLIGEISDDKGYQYSTIYGGQVTSQVGLLNVFDPVFNDELSDFFRVNNTSPIGSMEYVTYSNGLLGEADVREYKHIVPVVHIKTDQIKSGDGTKDNPYLVG